MSDEKSMLFQEIELSDALKIIGEGNPDKNLFFTPIIGRLTELQNYEMYRVYADSIKDRKWYLRIK